MQKVIMLQYFQRLFLQLPTLCWLQNKKAFVLAVVKKCLTIFRIKTKDYQKVDRTSDLVNETSICLESLVSFAAHSFWNVPSLFSHGLMGSCPVVTPRWVILLLSICTNLVRSIRSSTQLGYFKKCGYHVRDSVRTMPKVNKCNHWLGKYACPPANSLGPI